MPNLLYNKNSLIGILKNYFYLYFESFPVGTAENLFMFVLSVIALESANSIRFLYIVKQLENTQIKRYQMCQKKEEFFANNVLTSSKIFQ